jgi:hypothetical protein
MTELVRYGKLTAKAAVTVAQAIHADNPLHIPASLVDRFAEAVRLAEGEGSGS